MKIGVISDTHISVKTDSVPEPILEAFKSVDMVIHVGDLVDLAVLKQLKKVCPDVRAVFGNMDGQEIKDKLPEKEIIKIGKFKLGVMHGWGAPANLIGVLTEAFKKDKVNVIIFGHSHTPYNENKDGILFFNPGSPTDKVYAPYNSYGLIEINGEIKAKIIRI